jgi:class 3 adenylate cyclase
VEPKAQELLFSNQAFADLFNSKEPRNAFVLSADLRRSTTLMLKARNPELFAMFLQHFCDRLYNAVLDNHGVFDKFTGDGILAFFPEFYSGEDAGYLALKTASTCHEIFNDEYRQHRHCFSSVLSEVGLGIGIDFGPVYLVNLWGGLTVVGTPVVYACRMGNAPAGKTLLNQPAYERALEKYRALCIFKETELEVKGEGKTIAYEIELGTTAYKPEPPDWPSLIEKFSGA